MKTEDLLDLLYRWFHHLLQNTDLQDLLYSWFHHLLRRMWTKVFRTTLKEADLSLRSRIKFDTLSVLRLRRV